MCGLFCPCSGYQCWIVVANSVTATSLRCPLGHLNFNGRNYIFVKNNILIKCPLEPDHSGAVTLQKKRKGCRDLEFEVSSNLLVSSFQSYRVFLSLCVL